MAFNIAVTSKYNPFTYEDYIKPLEGYWEDYEKQEAALADLINGEEVVAYDSATDSTAIVYQNEVDKILGTGLYSQVNKNIIDEAIALTEKINNEIITDDIQTDYSNEMVETATKMMRPLITYCIFGLIDKKFNATKMIRSKNTPNTIPLTLPVPPTNDTPPITQAAIASHS